MHVTHCAPPGLLVSLCVATAGVLTAGNLAAQPEATQPDTVAEEAPAETGIPAASPGVPTTPTQTQPQPGPTAPATSGPADGAAAACDPPCPPGYECTPELYCVLAPRELSEGEVEANHKMEIRLAHRTKWRFELIASVGITMMWDETLGVRENLNGPAVEFGAGIRKNYAEKFGFQARVSLAHAWLKHRTDIDSGNAGGMTTLTVDATHVFGPLSRFYVGPNLFYARSWFERDESYAEPVTRYFRPISVYGGGADMGILAGSREEIDINWRFLVGPGDAYDFFYKATAGVGYNFM